MAGPRKKRVLGTNADSDSENNEQDESMEGDMIMADFEGRNPDAADFHGITGLLRQLFLKAHVSVSELADIIIAQQGLGSVLKQSMDDDDDEEDDVVDNNVFGVTTIINLTSNQTKQCIQQLYDNLKTLSKKHAPPATDQRINAILSDDTQKIGLLLNERFLNIPAKIADPLLDSLMSEVTRIATKNPSFDFDYFIMICKTYNYPSAPQKSAIEFINPEEEIFADCADVSFEFSVEGESDTGVGGLWTEDDKKFIPHRRVLVLSAHKLPDIIKNVKTFVN